MEQTDLTVPTLVLTHFLNFWTSEALARNVRSAFEPHKLLIIVRMLIVVLNRNAAKEETLLWNTPELTS